MVVEDPDTFLFEFDVLCRSYDYTLDAQKLKLFPATLKGASLRWFMGLGSSTIRTWNRMKETFISKYQDYCRTKDLREEIFRITQKEDEILEDYVERFCYNLQRSKFNNLTPEVSKTIFIRGMRDDCLEHLNLLGQGDISQETFNEIIRFFLISSRGWIKGRSLVRDPSV